MPILLAAMIQQNTQRILFALSLLGGAVIVLGLGLWYYRRRWSRWEDTSAAPWTLEEIRALRDRGAINEQEYQVLRAQVLGLPAGGKPSDAPLKPEKSDASGDTVWSFDLKKTPPG